MHIDGLGSSVAPSVLTGAAASQAQPADKEALLLAVEQELQKGGGGGGGGGGHGAHGVRKIIDPIEDIAARASLNIETRKKTAMDRANEIEQLKAEMAEAEDNGEDAPDDDARERERDERPRPDSFLA